jgi:YidC/Oxa1 family membrane protein insertase
VIDNRNLILAIVFSLAILLGFEFLVNAPQRERLAEQQRQEQALTPDVEAPVPEIGEAPASPGTLPEAPAAMTRAQALEESPRLAIDTPSLRGSIALEGARIDDLILKKYRETIEDGSPEIVLLSPSGAENTYYATFGWGSADRALELPSAETLWQADGKTLTQARPVTLSWTNGQGIRFEQVLSVNEDYLFTVTQRVVNESGASVSLAPYGLISRTGHPDILGFYILHEGLIGVFDNTLNEIDYDDLESDRTMKFETIGGWIGITDKYWQAVLLPDQEKPVDAQFRYLDDSGPGRYLTDFIYETVAVPAGADVETTSRIFAGAKEVTLLDRYQEELNIARFDRAVDFGWFYFLTKPFFYALHYFAGELGNFGLSILLLTVIVKLLFFPLANKSYRAMAKMKKLAPEMQRLKERFGEDRQRLNQEMMALYKKEGANPAAGCLPLLIQIPVFFALYKVLFVSIEMRHAPFYGWVQDLSARDPTSILNGFGLLPWDATGLGLLDIVSPQPTDPVQAKIFQWMPVIFTFLLAKFPAGLVIYWTWNNLLSILQQMVIMKRAGVPFGGKQLQPAPAPAARGSGKAEPERPPERADHEDEDAGEVEETTQVKARVARAEEASRARRKSRRNRKRPNR